MIDRYAPQYRITPAILHCIEEIGEAFGNLRVAFGIQTGQAEGNQKCGMDGARTTGRHRKMARCRKTGTHKTGRLRGLPLRGDRVK
jgi:hypothetical protein